MNFIQTMVLVERVCGICSHSHALCYALALESIGGVKAVEAVNIQKAAMLYDFLDNSTLFNATAQKEFRSIMNVTFVTGDKDKDAAFVKFAASRGLVNLKGHRVVGGIRASIYNAMPMEGVKTLAEFMKKFEMEHK